jgi:hypothetical protein
MKRFYTVFILVISTLMLISFSANPPDGKTGAPGDSLCTECHSPSNPPINGTISVEGFPSSITPGESYVLTVVNRNTIGDAVKGGFQMTILGPTNTKAGELKDPSANSVVTNFNSRQYFEHNPAQVYPDSNVLKWTVEWTAPMMDPGTQITWYAAGNIANGNFNNTGDRIVTNNGSGSIILARTDDLVQAQPLVYPNPGTDHLNIVMDDGTPLNGNVEFYSVTGDHVGSFELQDGRINTPEIPAGVYVLQCKTDESLYVVRWTKL